MKVEIDLNDILGDENGAETLQDSVRRQVIHSLENTIRAGVSKRIEQETARVINDCLQSAVVERMPEIVDQVLNGEYTPIDRYGNSAGKVTTFRQELRASILEQMQYKPSRSGYSSERNAFTKAVDDLVSTQVGEFKTTFNKMVDAEFTKEALNHATTKLTERLGIKK